MDIIKSDVLGWECGPDEIDGLPDIGFKRSEIIPNILPARRRDDGRLDIGEVKIADLPDRDGNGMGECFDRG